jgi:hypothetical protein
VPTIVQLTLIAASDVLSRGGGQDCYFANVHAGGALDLVLDDTGSETVIDLREPARGCSDGPGAFPRRRPA